jgi:hypothetical protein
MMQWFGESWGAPVCSPGRRTDIPVGTRCDRCALRIHVGDRGLVMMMFDSRLEGTPELRVYHLECFLVTVLPV